MWPAELTLAIRCRFYFFPPPRETNQFNVVVFPHTRIEKKSKFDARLPRKWIFVFFGVFRFFWPRGLTRAGHFFLSRRSRQIPFSRKKATEYYLNFFKTGAQCTCQMGERKCSISLVLWMCKKWIHNPSLELALCATGFPASCFEKEEEKHQSLSLSSFLLSLSPFPFLRRRRGKF